QVDGGTIEIVLQPVVVEEIAMPIQARRAQQMLSGNTLVLQVVERITNAGMDHAQALVDLVEQHRRQRGLPIVAMDDVRVLVAPEHELQGGPAEKGKALVVIPLAVKHPAIEEIVLGVWFNEEALAPMDKS